MKIAAFINNRGRCLPLYSQGVIRLYSDEGGSWQPILDFLFALPSEQGMESVRESLMAMLSRLRKAGCQDLIARSIPGFSRSILDGMGFEMWRLDGSPDAYLDRIREQHRQQGPEPEVLSLSAQNEEPSVSFLPLPVGALEEGRYCINLKSALAVSGKTSKQLLLPFVRAGRFAELEVICDHLPKWFDKELTCYGISCRVDTDTVAQIHAYLVPASLPLVSG